MKLPRWWFYLVIGLIALAGAVFGPQPADVLTLGSADASDATPRAASPARLDPAGARGEAQGRAFDYFPDQYRNQAQQPADPIATF